MKPVLLLLLVSVTVRSQQIVPSVSHLQVDASFRGLSVVNNNVAWLGGSNGWVGYTTNGCKDWTIWQVQGYEQCDFRSVYAFDAKNVVIANAGSPAYVLRTSDSGNTWKEVYRNEDKSAFIDGIDFWNGKNGIAYGDPLQGRMMILTTNDGGRTWTMLPEEQRPRLEPGEASFAASGTTIRCTVPNKVTIATGGSVSRLWSSDNGGASWTVTNTPIVQGDSSTGIFSVAFSGSNAIIVGGDYKDMSLAVNHVFLAEDGMTWVPPFTPTRGYRECVEYINKNVAVATGPGGTDITRDGGKNWQPLDDAGFHVVRKARSGNLVILAGAKGMVAVLKMNAH
jgi:photosystem II stability/assembly factor-like uncharacterized protein